MNLQVASVNGYEQIVKYLCSKKKTKVNALDYLNHTPLYFYFFMFVFF